MVEKIRGSEKELLKRNPVFNMRIDVPHYSDEDSIRELRKEFLDPIINIISITQREPMIMVAGNENRPSAFLDLPPNTIQIATETISVVGGITGILGFAMQLADKIHHVGEAVNKKNNSENKIPIQHVYKLNDSMSIVYILKFEDKEKDEKIIRDFKKFLKKFHKFSKKTHKS